MKTIFDPVTFGGIVLKNRILRSATFESPMNPENKFADTLWSMYQPLISGGVGAIITGMMGIDDNSRVSPKMVSASSDSFNSELSSLIRRVHAANGKIIVQLSHCGQKAILTEKSGEPLGPSDAAGVPGGNARAMTKREIAAMAEAYAVAADKCRNAGADAIEMHAAHGYLLSEFLSPYFNKRTDEYGGEIVNRARVVFAVYEAIRSRVGKGFPIWIKINSKDLLDDGFTAGECRWVCGELAKRGIDAIELSGGAAVSAATSSAQPVKEQSDEGRFAPEAVALADHVSVPVASVCGYRTPDIIEQWLNKGGIEAIAMCRPFIAEPGLVSRWMSGDRTRARCVSCNECFKTSKTSFGIGCTVFK